MATTSRRKNLTLADRLRDEAWRFDFFQAVRLLEINARREDADSTSPRRPVGYDRRPDEEVVRFAALSARHFPAGSVSGVSFEARDGVATEDGGKVPARMTVAFMGLTGPSGVLPESYLDVMLTRIRNRDHALRDFFDLFNHRTISLFYRAWEKYRLPVSYERARAERGRNDLFTLCLRCLSGMGTGGLESRLALRDETQLYYGGHYSHFPRSAVVLQAMLCDRFSVPVQIDQFQGRWLALAPDDRTRLPARRRAAGRHHRLTHEATAGARVFDVQGAFKVRLGPLSIEQFSGFMPDGERYAQLEAMVRSYVGPGLDYDLQVVLEADQVPVCRPERKRSQAPRLGWNTWLRSHTRRRRPATEPRFNPNRLSRAALS